MPKTLSHSFEVPVPQQVVYQFARALLKGDLVQRQLPQITKIMIPMQLCAEEPFRLLRAGGTKLMASADYTYNFHALADGTTLVELRFTVGGLIMPYSGEVDLVSAVETFAAFAAGWASGKLKGGQENSESFLIPTLRERA